MQAPTLTTDRLILAPLSMQHWDAYAAMWADPRTTAFIGGGVRSRDDSWRKFAAAAGLWNLIGYGYWAFTDRGTQALLGVGGLSDWQRGIDGLTGFPETGWAFAPDAWGRGYATEAMQAVLVWADTVLALLETRCIIDPSNQPSQRVAEKLGYRHLKTTDEAIGPTALYSRQRCENGRG
jgi:RimJ/RimL family protein N-acetyltransferase